MSASMLFGKPNWGWGGGANCDLYRRLFNLSAALVEIYPSYRKSWSTERMTGLDFGPEAPKQPFPHTEVLLF